MQEGNWQGNRTMLSNGEDSEMSGNRNPTGGHRSQDDAMVGYFFQRPQTDMAQQYNSKRWAVGDDSVIEQVRVNDLERDFGNLAFGNDGRQDLNQHAKKIWDDDKAGGDASKGMFPGSANPWSRDDGWNANPSETGALGVNMAEYVLGGSPVQGVGKDLDSRLRQRGPNGGPAGYGPGGDGDKQGGDKGAKSQSPFEGEVKAAEAEVAKELQNSNGIMQNGLEDRPSGSRQNSPTEIDQGGQVALAEVRASVIKPDDHLQLEAAHHLAAAGHHHPGHNQIGLHLDTTPQFEMGGIDHFLPAAADYTSHLIPSMDSPNFSIEYQQQRQQPIAILTQQQYAMAQQQQQLASAGLPPPPMSQASPFAAAPNPYTIMNPGGGAAPHQVAVSAANEAAAAAALGIQLGPNAGQVMPQYYSVQAPWGIYPAAGLLQQQGLQGQQQPQPGTPTQGPMVRGHTPRSLTPSQDAGGGLGTPTGQLGGTPQYQILTPAYYDQNGQLVMGNPAGRGLGTPVRLVSPAPVLIGGQQGNQGPGAQPGTIQILTSQQQIPMGAPMALQTPPHAHGQHDKHMNADGLSERRGSLSGGAFDYKRPGQLPQLSQYYGAFSTANSTSPAAGPMGLVQAQSLTPPPSLNGSATNLAFGGAAAGMSTAGLLGSSFLTAAHAANNRLFPKTASLSKEGTSRSRLLEDFRNNRIPNLQLKDLVNHVVEFSQDQHGSRFIQQKLERATPAEKQMVFNEILSAAYSLMTDVFGNYVIQKFFEFGTSEQKQTLAQRVRGHVLPLALQMYGCRVIQKALESIPQEMQVTVEIVKELDGHVLKCVKDQNGNHVVQKCIECVEPANLQFILDAFRGQIFTLSTHPYGCRVIQRILEHCIPEQTGPILDELHSQTERLVQDQYGNYVIQHVLEHGRQDDKAKIVLELRGKMLILSQHKFASNVVEKCITHSNRADRSQLIEEVCGMNDGALYTMMKDQFANYVVQKMIDVADGTQRKMLLHKIRPHVATLRKFTYGKHILAKLEKFYMKTSDLGPIGMPPNGALQ